MQRAAPIRYRCGRLHTQKTALQARLNELAALFAEGSINGAQLKRGTAELSNAVSTLDAELAAATQGNPVAGFLAETDDDRGPLEARWAKLSPDIRGKIIDQLLEVTVNRSPRGLRRFDPAFIGIKWKAATVDDRRFHIICTGKGRHGQIRWSDLILRDDGSVEQAPARQAPFEGRRRPTSSAESNCAHRDSQVCDRHVALEVPQVRDR